VSAAALFWARFGRAYPDEGFHLACGSLAWDGLVPYRDFLWTQGPLPLYLFGAAAKLIAPTIWAGRAISAFLAAGAGIAAVALARRSAGPRAGLVAAALIATGAFAMAHLSFTKGYSSAALLLTLGVLVIAPLFEHGAAESVGRAAAGGALLGASALARPTTVVFLVALTVCLAAAGRPKGAAAAGLTAAATAVAGFAPFLILAPAGVRYGLLRFHEAGVLANPDPWRDAPYRYLPILIVAAAAAAAGPLARGLAPFRRHAVSLPLTVSIAALLIVQTVVGGRRAEYHCLVYPLAAALAALWLSPEKTEAEAPTKAAGKGRRPASPPPRLVPAAGLAFAVIWGAFFSAPEAAWLVPGSYYPDPPDTLVTAIRTHSASGDPLLCLRPELALLAGRPLLRGTEMGTFALFAPRTTPADPGEPPGLVRTPEWLSLIGARQVTLVALREGDLDNLNLAAAGTRGAPPFEDALLPALQRGYRLVLRTTGDEGGRRRHVWELWERLPR